MRFLMCLLAVLISACSNVHIPLLDVVEKEDVCDLDYSPYQATVTGHCQDLIAQLPESVPVMNKSITIKPLEQIPEIFWFNKKMNYSLVKQETIAPVIFVIAGTGASFESSKMKVLQKNFYQQGYHVISVSSPTFANFIVNADNNNYLPGDLSHDAQALYNVMQRMWQQVQNDEKVQASSFSVTGYSLGAAHSAFVSKLDEEKKVFNFEKVLLINPPVTLYNSVSILDGYFDLQNNKQAAVDMFDNIFARFSQNYSTQASSSIDEDAIFTLFKKTQLSEKDLKLLIGASFRISSSDMLFALDASFNLGMITYKNHHINKLESVTHSMLRASNVTFVNYFEKIMLAQAQWEDASITKEDLIQRYSLLAIEDYLKNSEKISLMTNKDDIILAKGEVEYLQSLFSQRAKIFPRGGHCGNMDRLSFIEHLNATFSPRIQ